MWNKYTNNELIRETSSSGTFKIKYHSDSYHLNRKNGKVLNFRVNNSS